MRIDDANARVEDEEREQAIPGPSASDQAEKRRGLARELEARERVAAGHTDRERDNRRGNRDDQRKRSNPRLNPALLPMPENIAR